jgi:spermidine/putrescine transport system substrate-binding protein
MKKTTLFLLTSITIFAILMTGCGSGKSDQVTINVYNWGDYIAEETIEKFEAETGIKVIYEQFDSNESMYTKLKSGAVNYDVLFPSDYMIEKLIQEDMLAPLDFTNLPNYSNIDEDFKNLSYDPKNTYSVPYMWGTLGILYNTTMVAEEVNSWSVLWDKAYTNQIVMKDSVRDSFVPALRLLGYSINSTSKDEWNEALALLQEQKALVQAYVADEVRDKMIGEEAALAVMYSGEALLTMDENENLAYVVPNEGSNKWFDSMCIPKSTNNKEAAEKFINFMCDITIAYENADYIGYSTPISASKALLSEELQANPAAYPSSSILDKCDVFLDLGKEMSLFIGEKWNELKAY